MNTDQLYYAKHKERLKLKRAEYYKTHEEEIRALRKRYKEANGETIRLRDRVYYQKNKKRHNARVAVWKEKNPEKQKGYSKKARINLRLDVFWHYATPLIQCVCCGETEFRFLSIDHINGKPTVEDKRNGRNLYGWLRKNNYPTGFQILCHNCNLAKGFYGRCPHKNS